MLRIHDAGDPTAPPFPADVRWSALAHFGDRLDPISHFKQLVRHLWTFKLVPDRMSGAVNKALKTGLPGTSLEHFGTWYARLLAQKPAAIAPLFNDLKNVIDGFEELAEDNARITLSLRISQETHLFDFDELSDGQRALIGLGCKSHFAW